MSVPAIFILRHSGSSISCSRNDRVGPQSLRALWCDWILASNRRELACRQGVEAVSWCANREEVEKLAGVLMLGARTAVVGKESTEFDLV